MYNRISCGLADVVFMGSLYLLSFHHQCNSTAPEFMNSADHVILLSLSFSLLLMCRGRVKVNFLSPEEIVFLERKVKGEGKADYQTAKALPGRPKRSYVRKRS